MRIAPFAAADTAAWLRLLNLTRPVPLSAEDFAAREAQGPEGEFLHRCLGRTGTATVAIGQLAAAPYAPADHLALLICTDPEWRGRGCGTAMLAHLEGVAAAQGYAGLAATLPETAQGDIDWMQRRGYLRHALRFDSLLDLASLPLAAIEAAPPPDLCLQDMTGATEARWQEVCDLFAGLLADAPDMRGLPRWSRARCETVLRRSPSACDRWVIVARAGDRAVGLTVGHALGGGDLFLLHRRRARPARHRPRPRAQAAADRRGAGRGYYPDAHHQPRGQCAGPAPERRLGLPARPRQRRAAPADRLRISGVGGRRGPAGEVRPDVVGLGAIAVADAVVTRIDDAIHRGARSDDEASRRPVGPVLEAMRDGHAGLERGGIAGAQKGLAVALDQRDLALEDEDHLVLGLVPVREGRAGSRFQNLDEGAELRKAGSFIDPQRASMGEQASPYTDPRDSNASDPVPDC